MTKNFAIYQAKKGVIGLKADSSAETIWASQKQIAQIFDATPQNITIYYITQGHTINKNCIEQNYNAFMLVVEDVNLLAKNQQQGRC